MHPLTVTSCLENQIETASQILRDGGVVALPTDTIYGLMADALNKEAVRRVFLLKNRPKEMPLPLLIVNADDVQTWAIDIPDITWPLIQSFWPGALTLILKKASCISEIVSGGLDTIALRVPNHIVPRTIAKYLGTPITGTSANRSGSASLSRADQVKKEFGDCIDLIIDTGETLQGISSTVLDLSGKHPRILREGAITRSELEMVCGDLSLITS